MKTNRIAYPQRLFLLLILLLSAAVSAQDNCLKNAHSHNDYRQEHPLTDALKYRFASIEADVFLIHSELYVSHTYPFSGKQTLDSLYLYPLLKAFKERK